MSKSVDSKLNSSVRVADLGSLKKAVRVPSTISKVSNMPKRVSSALADAHEEVELIVHELHNVLDDRGADGIVDYMELEAQLKRVINSIVSKLAK